MSDKTSLRAFNSACPGSMFANDNGSYVRRDDPNGKFCTMMTRNHPVCDRCYVAWFEGAGTDRDSIRAALQLPDDGVKESGKC